MKAKKQLGQNFLTSVPARIAIVNAGGLSPNDVVLEIGPGRGFLTEGLLETGAHVVALEKDPELIPFLKERFSMYKNFFLIEGDALMFSPRDENILSRGYKLIANIPYYITGAILERYLSHDYQPILMVVLVQKEVAERVVARNGKESILSVSVKAYGAPKIIYQVKRGSFNPIPNVDSSVLSIGNISRSNFKSKEHEKNFFTVVKAGFSHKRKFLLSNLSGKLPKKDWRKFFMENNIDLKIRAEDMRLKEWLLLAL